MPLRELPSVYHHHDISSGSGVPEIPSSYRPSLLTVDQRTSQAQLLGAFIELGNFPIGTLMHAKSAQEALDMIRERQGEFDIVLLTTGRQGFLGMTTGDFMAELKHVAPDALPVLLTGGMPGEQGVPTRKELHEMGINHVYEGPSYPKDSNDYKNLIDEIRVASFLRKQNPPLTSSV